MAKTARKVKDLKRRYDGIGELNINKYYEINPNGLKTVLKIMKIYKLDYDCELIDVTEPIVDMCKAPLRELYCIDTTGQVLKILKYIKDNNLLSKKGSES